MGTGLPEAQSLCKKSVCYCVNKSVLHNSVGLCFNSRGEKILNKISEKQVLSWKLKTKR